MATASLATEHFAPEMAAASSPLGAVAVALVDGRIVATSIGRRHVLSAKRAVKRALGSMPRSEIDDVVSCEPSISPGGPDSQHSDAKCVVELLLRYCEGRLSRQDHAELARMPIADGHLTEFQSDVVATCRAIPLGQTRTYGEVARLAGRPGAARAVGRVMATNRVPLIVPCHRVVASSGKLGGFSAPQGVVLKRRLLDLERTMVGASRLSG